MAATDRRDSGPAELAEQLGMHKSTVHRLLVVLERQGAVRRHEGRYALGMRLFELGSRAVTHLDVGSRAVPYLRRLVQGCGETAHVAVLGGLEMMSIQNVECPKKLRTPVTVGGLSPVHATSVGKAVLAFLPDDECELILEQLTLRRFTPRTITARTALRLELQRVRDRGFAVDDQEIESGLRCVGAPIRNHTGRVIAAISVAGPIFRVTQQRVPALARAVIAAGRDLSRDLGFVDVAQFVRRPQASARAR